LEPEENQLKGMSATRNPACGKLVERHSGGGGSSKTDHLVG